MVTMLGCAIAAAVAACGDARAQQGSAAVEEDAAAARLAEVVTVPAAWRTQPAIAAAARRAAGEGTDVAAWGEAGQGCFAIVVAARAERQHPEDALEELRATMATQLGLEGWTVVSPTDVHGRVVRGALRGEVRGGAVAVAPGGAAVTLAACFYNQRDPEGCAAQCQGVLASLDAAKVKP